MAIKRTKDIDPKLAAQWEAEDREDGDKWEKGDYGKNPKFMQDASPKETAKLQEAAASIRNERRRGRPKSEDEHKGIFMNFPLDLLNALKLRAKKLNIGYQSYIKMALTQHLGTAEDANDDTSKTGKPAKKGKQKRPA